MEDLSVDRPIDAENLLAPRSEEIGAERISLGIVQSHPIQYFAPLFRELAGRPDVNLTVYYCSRQGLDQYVDREFGVPVKWDVDLLDGYRSVFVPSIRSTGRGGFFDLANPSLFNRLRCAKHDAVMVHGYSQLSHWIAFAAAKASAAVILLRGESQLLNQRSLWRRAVKQIVLRPLFASIGQALYLGNNNRAFYRAYGVSDARLTHVPYVVDNDRFRSQAESLKPEVARIRREWGIPADDPVVLFSGKLVKKKQPLLLLQAFAQVRRRHRCFLLIAGDGPLREQIEARVADLGLSESVRILGFLNQTQIGKAYAVSDILALPSLLEPWGLVVNEAMNFGLAILASKFVGSASDLVQHGLNGYVVSAMDHTDLAERLETLVGSPAMMASFQEASTRIIRRWSIGRAASGIVSSARTALKE